MKKTITPADILPLEEYVKVRPQKRTELVEMKKNRNIPIGPDAILIFENYDTMWFQIQEMLYIEKGGEEQLEDELRAYNPLIPQGKELVFTFMIEIDDADRRRKTLAQLGHVEEMIFLRFGSHSIQAQSKEADVARTTAAGKTSSVHFLHFPFTEAQVTEFKQSNTDIIIEITHPNYLHKVLFPEHVRSHISKDFD